MRSWRRPSRRWSSWSVRTAPEPGGSSRSSARTTPRPPLHRRSLEAGGGGGARRCQPLAGAVEELARPLGAAAGTIRLASRLAGPLPGVRRLLLGSRGLALGGFGRGGQAVRLGAGLLHGRLGLGQTRPLALPGLLQEEPVALAPLLLPALARRLQPGSSVVARGGVKRRRRLLLGILGLLGQEPRRAPLPRRRPPDRLPDGALPGRPSPGRCLGRRLPAGAARRRLRSEEH